MAESEKHPGQRRYLQEMKDRGVRVVREVANREGTMRGLIPTGGPPSPGSGWSRLPGLGE